MAPFPEQGTPQYDERIEQARQRLRNGPRLRFRILVWAGIVVTMVLPGIYFIVRSFCADALLGERLGGALFGTIFLLLPGRILFVAIRRHRQTGIWSLKATPEERVELARKWDQTPRWRRTDRIFLYVDLGSLPLYMLLLWLMLRPHRGPHDFPDWLLIGVYTLLAAQCCWSLANKWRHRKVTA